MLRTQHKVMDKYLGLLSRSSLFANLSQKEIKLVLERTGARIESYEKGETVIGEGSAVTDIGIVLSGKARSIKHDISGKALIISLLGEGGFIGVLLAASIARKSPLSIQALEDFRALFIPFERILAADCPSRDVLLRNCFDSIAEKSMLLYERIECLICPSVREKITSYLTRLATENGVTVFMSPLDRNAMAEYLNVDRSALSRELSAMKSDGLIDYYKSSFRLFYL